MKLKDIKKDQRVVYTPKNEKGVVTSKNDTFVFVRYDGNTGSQATRPEDLKLED